MHAEDFISQKGVMFANIWVWGWGKNVQKNTLICIREEREVLKCKYICRFLSLRHEYKVMDQGSFKWGGGLQIPGMVLAA